MELLQEKYETPICKVEPNEKHSFFSEESHEDSSSQECGAKIEASDYLAVYIKEEEEEEYNSCNEDINNEYNSRIFVDVKTERVEKIDKEKKKSLIEESRLWRRDEEAETKFAGEKDEERSSDEGKKGGKKKQQVANPSHWIREKVKMQRNSGEAYTSLSRSRKHFEAKTLRPPCGTRCRLQCSKRIREDTRRSIFKNYWGLADLLKQRNFISKCMEQIKPVYRYPKNEKKRKLNNAFFFDVDEKKIRVCKSFFKATLDINDRPIRTVLDKLDKGFLTEDLRGKHNNHNKVNSLIKEGVRKHIESLPRLQNYYLCQQANREFIDGGKSLVDLFRDYKTKCISKGLPHANRNMYSRIFNTEFNISFFVPEEE